MVHVGDVWYSLVPTCSAFAVRVQVREYVPGGVPRTGQAGPDEADPLALADDLHQRVLAHVALQLLLQVSCGKRKQS